MRKLSYASTLPDSTFWVLWSFATVLVFLVTMFSTIHFRVDRWLGMWVAVPAMSPLVVVPLAVGMVRRRLQRRRAGELAAVLGRAGFRLDPEPALSTRALHYRKVEEVLGQLWFFRGDAKGCYWIAWEVEGTLDKEPGAFLFEHVFMVGSGRATQTFEHTVLVWPHGHADVAGGWIESPRVSLGVRSRGERRLYAQNELPVPALTGVQPDWQFHGSPEQARRLLENPEVLGLLQESPRGECWQLGGGLAAVSYAGFFQPAGLLQFLNHATRLARALR